MTSDYKICKIDCQNENIIVSIKNINTGNRSSHYCNDYGYSDDNSYQIYVTNITDDLELCTENLQDEAYSFFGEFYGLLFPDDEIRDKVRQIDSYWSKTPELEGPLFVISQGSSKILHDNLRKFLPTIECNDINSINVDPDDHENFIVVTDEGYLTPSLISDLYKEYKDDNICIIFNTDHIPEMTTSLGKKGVIHIPYETLDALDVVRLDSHIDKYGPYFRWYLSRTERS